MTPPADKPWDRRDVVAIAKYALGTEGAWKDRAVTLTLARAVLAMDEELRKAAESGEEKGNE